MPVISIAEIDKIYPLKHYEFVVVVDTQSHDWTSLQWKSTIAIGILLPPFQHQLRDVTFREVLDALIHSPFYGKDRSLLVLYKLLREFVTNSTSELLNICTAQSAWLHGPTVAAVMSEYNRVFHIYANINRA